MASPENELGILASFKVYWTLSNRDWFILSASCLDSGLYGVVVESVITISLNSSLIHRNSLALSVRNLATACLLFRSTHAMQFYIWCAVLVLFFKSYTFKYHCGALVIVRKYCWPYTDSVWMVPQVSTVGVTSVEFWVSFCTAGALISFDSTHVSHFTSSTVSFKLFPYLLLWMISFTQSYEA